MDWDTFKKYLLPQLPLKVALCGWSIGGLFATRLALEHPKRVSHLIQIASSPCFMASNTWPGISADELQRFYEKLQANPKQVLTEFVQLQYPTGMTLNFSSLNRAQSINLAGLRNGLDILKHWNFCDDLSTLRCPTAYLFGRRDRIVPANLLDVMQKNYPMFDYERIPQAGHAPFLSHPEIFLNFMIQKIK